MTYYIQMFDSIHHFAELMGRILYNMRRTHDVRGRQINGISNELNNIIRLYHDGQLFVCASHDAPLSQSKKEANLNYLRECLSKRKGYYREIEETNPAHRELDLIRGNIKALTFIIYWMEKWEGVDFDAG